MPLKMKTNLSFMTGSLSRISISCNGPTGDDQLTESEEHLPSHRVHGLCLPFSFDFIISSPEKKVRYGLVIRNRLPIIPHWASTITDGSWAQKLNMFVSLSSVQEFLQAAIRVDDAIKNRSNNKLPLFTAKRSTFFFCSEKSSSKSNLLYVFSRFAMCKKVQRDVGQQIRMCFCYFGGQFVLDRWF